MCKHLPTQVRAIIFACTVVAKTTPQVTAPVSPMTTGKSPGQHQGTSTVLDHIWSKYQKFRSSTKKHMELYKPETSKHQKLRKLHLSWTTGTPK